MRLSEQQIAYFQTFGFLKFPGLLADQIGQIEAAFEGVWADHGGGHDGKPHDGTARSCLVPFIDQSERLCQLLDDERILAIARSLLGEDFNYCSSDGNYYVGDTQWHSDGWRPPEGYLYVKMAIYLDPLTRDTGCLRVIPGSHRPGDWFSDTLHAQVRGSVETLGLPGRDVPAIPLETVPGDLLLFNHNTKHAAFGGNAHRRMFTINLSQRYREADLHILKEQIGTRARFWLERAYGEKMVRTAGPERQRHLEQIMANDGHLAELTRQAKQRMTEPARG
jgi:ectoine hydroxylase-related dioxygenase (phytanoyl-CoA dioxygenase family)